MISVRSSGIKMHEPYGPQIACARIRVFCWGIVVAITGSLMFHMALIVFGDVHAWGLRDGHVALLALSILALAVTLMLFERAHKNLRARKNDQAIQLGHTRPALGSLLF